MESDDEDVEYEDEQFSFGRFQLSITTVSFLPIEKLMANAEKDVEISGQKLWCGSMVVVQYLMNQPHELHGGTTVIELGAGTGVLGMICSKLGVEATFLTDHDDRSLLHMKEDCLKNDVAASVVRLDWFHSDSEVDSLMNLVSEKTSSREQHNLLLVAGDVLYKATLLDPFFQTVRQLAHTALATSATTSPAWKPAVTPTAVRLLLCHVPRAGVDHADVLRKFAEDSRIEAQEIDPALYLPGLSSDSTTTRTTANETREDEGIVKKASSAAGQINEKSSILNYCPKEDLDRARLYCFTFRP